jgi:hypothetical protein
MVSPTLWVGEGGRFIRFRQARKLGVTVASRRLAPLSIMRHTVRQFVPVVRATRKMLRQQLARFAHAVDDSLREFRLLEIAGHSRGHHLPELIPTTLVHALVADDGKFLGPRRDENQHAVSLARFGHAHFHEGRLRRFDWIGDFLVSDEHADFAGGLSLGFPDRGDDVVVTKLFKKFPGFHGSPTSSRAAATTGATSTGESTAAREPAASTTPAASAT